MIYDVYPNNRKMKILLFIHLEFGVPPCRFNLKNAINLKYQYDVNLLVLLIESETNGIIQNTIDYIHKIDSKVKIVLLKDKYGKRKHKKYKTFLKEITPEKFENINGMSKFLVFNKNGEIEMITTWKDSRKDDWKDDSNMIKNKIVPLLRLK